MPLSLPSLGAVAIASRRTLLRFPLVLAAAAIAAAGAVLAIEEVGPDWLHGRLVAAASLGIPLFLAAALLAERQRRRAAAQAALALAALVVAGAVFAAWPHWSEPVRVGRYAQLSVTFHLLVLLAPFGVRERPVAFWQFSRALLERLLEAAAFTGTLFAGLALALAALDKLFGVDVPGNAYARLWVVIAFVFNTWFFLGGVPAEPAALEERRDYPAALRAFAQYALIPLVTVYLVILTLYLGKVVVTWNWPSGWIGWLVSGVAGAGILALLLVQPLIDDPEQRWVATFARQFWVAVLPSIVMLWLALYQRVHQYGITERRYLLFALSLWLAALAVYYTVSRSRNIRMIPVTLCVAALVTFGGPWGAYSVSEASQVGRLRATLERAGMFAAGTVRRPAGEVSSEDRAEISAITRYLLETHGTAAIAPWFADTAARRAVLAADRALALSPDAADQVTASVVARLGVAYVGRGAVRTGGTISRFYHPAAEPGRLDVRGFDYLLSITVPGKPAADTGYQASWSGNPPVVRVVRARDTVAVVRLDSLVARLTRGQGAPAPGFAARDVRRAEAFVLEAASARARVRVVLSGVGVRDSAGTQRVDRVSGRVLLALKR